MASTLAWRWLLSLLLACAPLWLHAQALQPVPALTARVLDQTATLAPADRTALEAQLAAIESRHGSQVVVLMVASTAPEDIAAYAYRVASDWKIGRRDVGDGLLVVVAKNDRRMRIEVARRLEGAIPDIAAARIIDEAMAPRFRANDYAGGLAAAVSMIEKLIAGEQLPAPVKSQPKSQSSGDLDLESLAIFLFVAVSVLRPLARRIFGNRLGAVLMGAGTGAVAFWLTTSLLLAGGAGVVALLITLLSNGKGMHIGGGGGFGGGFGGGRGGGGFGGGGFSSGGGGSFGGGGASGSW